MGAGGTIVSSVGPGPRSSSAVGISTPLFSSVGERRAEIISQVVDELVELSLARMRSGEHELSAVLGKHRAESLARLADPLDQDDHFARYPNFSLHELRGRLRRSTLRE